MILLIFIIVSILVIIVKVIYSRKDSPTTDTGNIELGVFYSLEDKPAAARILQLSKAAAYNIQTKEELQNKTKIATTLFEERLVTDNYLRSLLNLDEELILEKIIIENEAETIKAGGRDVVFAEASKVPAYPNAIKKKKYFDEGLYLKRREMFLSKLAPKEISNNA